MKIKKAVGQLIVMILFLSCRNPTGNIDGQSQNTNYDLMKVSTTISKSIFTASYDYQSEMTDDSLIDWNVLYQIQSDGSYSEIIFKNDEDQDIRLNITKIVDISPGLIGIEYSQVQNIDSLSVTSSIKKAIIRTSDSFAFDFSEYDLNKALAYKVYLSTPDLTLGQKFKAVH